MPPQPPSATASARLWEKWSQIVLVRRVVCVGAAAQLYHFFSLVFQTHPLSPPPYTQTGAFVGGFAWWWGATHGSQESKPEGVSRKDPLREHGAAHPPRPPAEAASVKLAKAAGYVDAGVESGEEPVQGVFKDKKG